MGARGSMGGGQWELSPLQPRLSACCFLRDKSAGLAGLSALSRGPVAAKYDFQHLGMGNLLREEAGRPTGQGRQIKDIMMKGALVPLSEEAKGFLIDGFPRELNQAKEFENVVGRPPNIVIVLDCSTETMIQRLLLRGQTGTRADDNEATVRQRLETHYSLCEPVVAYYQQKNLLRNILGEEPEDAIFTKCCSVIDSLL